MWRNLFKYSRRQKFVVISILFDLLKAPNKLSRYTHGSDRKWHSYPILGCITFSCDYTVVFWSRLLNSLYEISVGDKTQSLIMTHWQYSDIAYGHQWIILLFSRKQCPEGPTGLAAIFYHGHCKPSFPSSNASARFRIYDTDLVLSLVRFNEHGPPRSVSFSCFFLSLRLHINYFLFHWKLILWMEFKLKFN